MREQDFFYNNMLKYSLQWLMVLFFVFMVLFWNPGAKVVTHREGLALGADNQQHQGDMRGSRRSRKRLEIIWCYHISMKIILLFEMGVTHSCDAFCVWCSSEGLTSSPAQTVHLIHNALTKGDVHLKLRCQPISIFLFWRSLPHLNKVLHMHLEDKQPIFM